MAFKSFLLFVFITLLGGCATKTSISYGDIYRSNSVPEGYATIGFHGKLDSLTGWDTSEDKYLVANILSPDNFVSISEEKKFLGIGAWIERCDKSGNDYFSGPIIMTLNSSPEIISGQYLYKAIFSEGMRQSINNTYNPYSTASGLSASELDSEKHCLFIGGSQYLNLSRLTSNPLPISVLE